MGPRGKLLGHWGCEVVFTHSLNSQKRVVSRSKLGLSHSLCFWGLPGGAVLLPRAGTPAIAIQQWMHPWGPVTQKLGYAIWTLNLQHSSYINLFLIKLARLRYSKSLSFGSCPTSAPLGAFLSQSCRPSPCSLSLSSFTLLPSFSHFAKTC